MSSLSVLGELEAKGYRRRKELACFPFGSRGRARWPFSHQLRRTSNWRQSPAGKSLKVRQERRRTLVIQCQPEMVGTLEVIFLTSSTSVADRPSVGETTIPMPCCIASEGRKDLSTEVDSLLTCLDKLSSSQEPLGSST